MLCCFSPQSQESGTLLVRTDYALCFFIVIDITAQTNLRQRSSWPTQTRTITMAAADVSLCLDARRLPSQHEHGSEFTGAKATRAVGDVNSTPNTLDSETTASDRETAPHTAPPSEPPPLVAADDPTLPPIAALDLLPPHAWAGVLACMGDVSDVWALTATCR